VHGRFVGELGIFAGLTVFTGEIRFTKLYGFTGFPDFNDNLGFTEASPAPVAA
jgi:hypothetical protein